MNKDLAAEVLNTLSLARAFIDEQGHSEECTWIFDQQLALFNRQHVPHCTCGVIDLLSKIDDTLAKVQ